jgi:hypothetical protein
MASSLARHFRRNLVGYLALLVALSGTGYAASSKLLPRNSVGTEQVIDHSLLKGDFRSGQLPRGRRGAQGLQGPQGQPGVVDTSTFYTKSQSDGLFLGKAAKAADADKLDGLDSLTLLRREGAIASAYNLGTQILKQSDNYKLVGSISFNAPVAEFVRIHAAFRVVEDTAGCPCQVDAYLAHGADPHSPVATVELPVTANVDVSSLNIDDFFDASAGSNTYEVWASDQNGTTTHQVKIDNLELLLTTYPKGTPTG